MKMEFEELQKRIGNTMSPLFVSEQKELFNKFGEMRNELQIVFSFKGSYTVEENPAEWLVIKYLDKTNYILVSLQNIIMLNDEFFSWLALKYVYEFYIKIKYISSSDNQEIFDERVQEYLTLNRKVRIENIVKKLEGEDKLLKKIRLSHSAMYRMMNSVAHPNVESLNLHKTFYTDEDRFNGLKENMQICMYLIAGSVEVASTDQRFGLVNKPNLEKIKILSSGI